MRIYDRDQTLFNSYWQEYKEHFGRHLMQQDANDSNYAYKGGSPRKKEMYSRWNAWLNDRTDGDAAFTVLSSNCRTFTLGALYELDTGDGTHIGVFVVVTPNWKYDWDEWYEWYVSTNSLNAVYLGRVPAHRSMAHLEHNKFSERCIDDEQTLRMLTGKGGYCYD